MQSTKAMKTSNPPALDLDSLDCHASIDYVTVAYAEKRPALLPKLRGIAKWHREKGSAGWDLTVHDPSYFDVVGVADALHNPHLWKLEIALDFIGKNHIPMAQRDEFHRTTFLAVAARFRPEDMTPWGYGQRAGVQGVGQKPLPFHRRLPSPDETLLYGHRDDYLQSKLYYKRHDQGAPLSPERHRVRMELTMRRGAIMEFQLDKLEDLIGFAYRSVFTKHFRIVSEPRVRLVRALDEPERIKRERRMLRAWATAGVGKFAVSPELPADTMEFAAARIRKRATQQLPTSQYVLVRDQRANEKIGLALRQLQRRMTP